MTLRKAKLASTRSKSTPAYEVHATSKHVLGMSSTCFLRDYWQKRPLLIRGMFDDDLAPITPDDLAGLACIDGVLARVVVRKPGADTWTLRNGPFSESDLTRLPRKNSTLLVQDVDKWDADVARLLEPFDFIPNWRLDDVMVSYATPGGGVGPHVDQYDVFLIQGAGRRSWRIDARANPATEFRSDSVLKLLRTFDATHAWELQPGDALYLPPGVPHDGVALESCLTFSVGMRAPSQAELLLDFADFCADSIDDTSRLVDPDLMPAQRNGEIDDAALERVRHAMPHCINVDKNTLKSWFGSFITRYRSAQSAVPPRRTFVSDKVKHSLSNATVLRHPFSRFAWYQEGRGARLFASGDALSVPLELAVLLSSSNAMSGAAILMLPRSAEIVACITALLNLGHLYLQRDRKPNALRRRAGDASASKI